MTEESRVPLYAASSGESRTVAGTLSGAPPLVDINRRGDTLSAGPVTSPSDTCYRFSVDRQQGEGSRLAKDTENGGSLVDASFARAHVASREHEKGPWRSLPVLQRSSTRALRAKSRRDSLRTIPPTGDSSIAPHLEIPLSSRCIAVHRTSLHATRKQVTSRVRPPIPRDRGTWTTFAFSSTLAATWRNRIRYRKRWIPINQNRKLPLPPRPRTGRYTPHWRISCILKPRPDIQPANACTRLDTYDISSIDTLLRPLVCSARSRDDIFSGRAWLHDRPNRESPRKISA